MDGRSGPARALVGARHAAALGAVAGGGEIAALGAQGRLGGPVGEVAALGLVDVLLLAGTSALVALLVAPWTRGGAPHRATAAQVAVAAAALGGLFGWPEAAQAVADGAVGLGVVFAAAPLLVGVGVYGQARYWLARQAGDGRPGGRAEVVAVVVAVALVAVGVGVRGATATASPRPGVLLVTVDGLRTDDLALPALALVADGSTWFTTAIAPSSSSLASHAALLTGLHPLRSRALDDLHPLPRGLATVAGLAAAAGLRTGAFLSSASVDGVGLEQGFAAVDAGFGPIGVGRLALVDALLGGRLVRRAPDVVAARALAWIRGGAGPFLAWVHLDRTPDPAATATAVRTLVDGVGAGTAVVVVGATGARPGSPLPPLSDAVVRVPLLLRRPGTPGPATVDAQVRLVDVAATVLALAGVERPDVQEGLDLAGFLDGTRHKDATALLVARTPDGRHVVGLRQDGVKGLFDPDRGTVEVYDLGADPSEAVDVAAGQPATASSVRAALEPDVAALRRVEALPELGLRRRARLAALGVVP